MTSGVCNSVIRAELNRKPSPLSSTLMPTTENRDVNTAVFIFSSFLAPNNWLITTEQPMFAPVATAIKIMVTG